MQAILVVLWLIITPTLISHLWSRRPADLLAKRLFWTLVLCIPVAGWVFYGGMYQPPAVQPRSMRARQTPGTGSAGR